VRKAELEASKNELLSAIDAKKNVLNLEEAASLATLEQDIQSRKASIRPQLRSRRAGNPQAAWSNPKSALTDDDESPMDGLLVIKGNYDFLGMAGCRRDVAPRIPRGDTVFCRAYRRRSVRSLADGDLSRFPRPSERT